MLIVDAFFTDKLVKESSIFLNTSDSTQLLLNGYYKIESPPPLQNIYDLKVSGVWKVNLKVQNVTVLSRKFLVMPRSNPFQIHKTNISQRWQMLFGHFWSFQSACVDQLNTSSFLTNHLLTDCQETSWSTYYPDPKSDITHNLSIEHKKRIL